MSYLNCTYCEICTYVENDNVANGCSKMARISYENSVREAFAGHDIQEHPHGFIINSKLIVGKTKFRFNGKPKWYWYNGDEKTLLKYL